MRRIVLGAMLALAPLAPRAETPTPAAQAAAITEIAEKAMATHGLRAIIVSVEIDGNEVVTLARGESLPGVAATPDMHFRNGAVAFSYIATILFQLGDEKLLDLDDTISTWRPDLPHADAITPRMLLTMTSGYADYVRDEGFIAAFYANPFGQWSADELVAIGTGKPLLFAPGTNWGYSHTGYVILGDIIEKVSGKPLADVMAERIFAPLGLANTAAPSTPAIPEPVLHAYSSERRESLEISESKRFYEESTFWNPSWTMAPGAVQTTDIHDLVRSAVAIGTGSTISPEAHRAMVAPNAAGFGGPTAECPACPELTRTFNYGAGVFLSGSWILQSPLFGGYAATEGYLPSRKIAIAVAVTFAEDGFTASGENRSSANTELFGDIAAYLAPDDAPFGRGD